MNNYGDFVLAQNELRDYVLGLERRLRDATDLLNDCGFVFIQGRWVDTQNLEEEE